MLQQQRISMTPAAVPLSVDTAAAPTVAAPTAININNSHHTTNASNINAAEGVAVANEAEGVATSDDNVHDFTGTTQSVEDSHIVTNTRNTYNRSLTDFMIFLFSHAAHKLVDTAPLIEAKAIDDGRRTTKQREAKRAFRAACLVQLKKMNRIEGNTPIHLSGPHAIEYEDIARYMGTKRRVVSVDPDLANRLAAEEGAAVINRAGNRGKVRVAVRLSDSSYSAVQSAISFLYRQCGLERPTEIKDGLALYCKGSKRKGRQLKQSLGLVISEGKKPMSKEVYELLAKKMFSSKKKEHIFSHLFLLLDW